MPKSFLISKAGISPNSVQNGVRRLVSRNLATESDEKNSLRHARIVELTAFGRRAAGAMAEVEEQIEAAQKHAPKQ